MRPFTHDERYHHKQSVKSQTPRRSHTHLAIRCSKLSRHWYSRNPKNGSTPWTISIPHTVLSVRRTSLISKFHTRAPMVCCMLSKPPHPTSIRFAWKVSPNFQATKQWAPHPLVCPLERNGDGAQSKQDHQCRRTHCFVSIRRDFVRNRFQPFLARAFAWAWRGFDFCTRTFGTWGVLTGVFTGTFNRRAIEQFPPRSWWQKAFHLIRIRIWCPIFSSSQPCRWAWVPSWRFTKRALWSICTAVI